jgi:hypothetical protein
MGETGVLEQEQQQVERLMRGWIVGAAPAPAMEQIPLSWRPLLQAQPAERQTLIALALCSQYQTLLFESQSSVPLQSVPDLPELSLPSLAYNLRPLFRRLLATLNKQGGLGPGPLLQLLLQRGVCAHPADWLPSPQEERLPKIYWPWSRWVAHQQALGDESDEPLNAENWDAFYPAERLMQLRGMRLTDPDGARALIKECAAREPADKRLRIIEVLATNLSQDDSEYLLSLINNRSQKISRLACQFLARLGIAVSGENEEQVRSIAQELAAGYEVKQAGLLRRHTQIVPRSLKSKKQRAIRTESLQKVLFQALAGALQIEESVLAAGWQFSANRDGDNHAFVLNALNTLPENLLETLLENALSQIDSSDQMLSLIQLFIPRLDTASSSRLMYRLLTRKGIGFSFTDCLAYSDQPLSELDWGELTKTRAWQQLLSLIKEHQTNENVYVEHGKLPGELTALGLMLPQMLAQQALGTLTEKGMMQADPALDALKLNAQLSPQ